MFFLSCCKPFIQSLFKIMKLARFKKMWRPQAWNCKITVKSLIDLQMIMNYNINKGTWKYSQSSSRGETISLILQPNQSFQINNNPNKLCLKYCPAFQNSLYQQIYFQSTSTQCPKLPRWSFGLIKSTSSPLPLNVKCSQAGAFDLSSCYLVLVGLH